MLGSWAPACIYIYLDFTTYYPHAPVRIFHGLREVCALESNQSVTTVEAPALTRPAVPLLHICSLGLHVNGHLFMSSRLLFGGEHLKLLWDKHVPQSTTQIVLAHRHAAGLHLLITINALHGFSTPSEITIIPELLCKYPSFRLISVLLTLLSLVTLPPHFYL